MAYEWSQDYEEGQTRATCSKCGVPYRWPKELERLDDGFFYCRRRCLEQTIKTRDKIIAQSRKRREMPPPKFVQPPQYADDYLGTEDAVFSTTLRDLGTSTDPAALAWGARYLADLCIEARRPARWIVDAKRVLAIACNRLLTLQYGAPTGPAPTVTSERVRYGGFASGTNLYTSITLAAGAALVKGYTVLGTVTYLDAAVRCAHFLRHMQCQDLDNNSQATQYAGGNYHIGGFAEGVSASGTITWISRYNVFDIAGVWLLGLLKTLQGGSTVYGGVAGADFTASTTATLDVMIAEVAAFAVSGAKDSAFGGALKSGLSTTYPRSYYAASLNTWILALSAVDGANVVRGEEVALALFGLDAAGQATATVTAVFDWLMTFTANPLNATPVEDLELLIGTRVGAYDPTLAIATELDVDTGTNQDHFGAGYSWLAGGLLAAIYSVRLPARFEAAKDAIGIAQPSNRGPIPNYRQIGETGYSGFAFEWSAVIP